MYPYVYPYRSHSSCDSNSLERWSALIVEAIVDYLQMYATICLEHETLGIEFHVLHGGLAVAH